MKNLLLTAIFFFHVENSFAQKKYFKWEIRKHCDRVRESKIKGTVILSLDTIFDKGIPCAILKKKKQIPYNAFGLYSLKMDKLILIQTRIGNNVDRTPYYAFMFVASDNVAEIEKYGCDIAKEVIKNNLLISDKIDPFHETKFLMKFPRKFSDPSIKTYITDNPEKDQINTSNIYETVKRNRESDFFFNEGKIMQDYKMIGRYKIIDTTIRFYLPNGIEVAEANEKEDSRKTWNVWSLKDRKNGLVSSDGDNSLGELIRYLLKNLYL